MNFQIKEVILWSNSDEMGPHRHEFQTGSVNVITGASKTGKSALIPIIDYCLCSSRCNIPIGVIRNKCSWFGVLVEVDGIQLLLARKNPGQKAQTGAMVLIEGEGIGIPDYISDNTKGRAPIETVKERLNQLARTTNLELEVGREENFNRAPGFRDLLAFNFQPQNIVANPNILFFRTDISEYRSRLRAILPYALGATSHDDVLGLWELQRLQRQLRILERKIEDQAEVVERWKSDLLTNFQRAKDLGLISSDLMEPESVDAGIKILRDVLKTDSSNAVPTKETLDATFTEIAKLDSTIRGITRELGVMRRRRDELRRLFKSFPRYQEALSIQRERLNLSKWLKNHQFEHANCPVCGGEMEGQTQALTDLCGRLSELEAEIEDVAPRPEAFAKEFQNVEQEVFQLVKRLQEARSVRRGIELTDDDIAEKRYLADEVSRFMGELSKAVEIYLAVASEDENQEERIILKNRIQDLQNSYSREEQIKRLKDALESIGEIAHELLPSLDAEYTDWPIRLDEKELSIRIRENEDYEVALWQIGSGANWLAYHVVMTLALQRYFSSLDHSPVPSFLIYDQPSQVYFPRARLAKDDDRDDYRIVDQEDIRAVRSVFEAFSSEIKNAKGELQIIVLDHARSEVWSGLDNINIVDEWRDGKKLVPDNWPERIEDSEL